ncbi:hypothetical protein GCM10028804_19720 [Larkinella terrae]
MIVLTILLAVKSVLSFLDDRSGKGSSYFSHEVMVFATNQEKPKSYVFDGSGPLVFKVEDDKKNSKAKASTDGLIKFFPIVNRYRLEVEPNSTLGYYSFAVILLNFLLIIGILAQFRQIFREANVVEPFKQSIFKRLKMLAILFVVSDVLKIVHYIIFNKLVFQQLHNSSFDLITQIGNGFITGLVIYAIAIIYQRGLFIQEENALTV